jgi:hypothetical protein
MNATHTPHWNLDDKWWPITHVASSTIGHTREQIKSKHLSPSYCTSKAESISTHYRHRFDFGDAVIKAEMSVEKKNEREEKTDDWHQVNKFMQNIMFLSSWLDFAECILKPINCVKASIIHCTPNCWSSIPNHGYAIKLKQQTRRTMHR